LERRHSLGIELGQIGRFAALLGKARQR
jgi:hypothetical protein